MSTPGCVELNKEEFVLSDFSIKVGISEDKDTFFLLDIGGIGSKSSSCD